MCVNIKETGINSNIVSYRGYTNLNQFWVDRLALSGLFCGVQSVYQAGRAKTTIMRSWRFHPQVYLQHTAVCDEEYVDVAPMCGVDVCVQANNAPPKSIGARPN